MSSSAIWLAPVFVLALAACSSSGGTEAPPDAATADDSDGDRRHAHEDSGADASAASIVLTSSAFADGDAMPKDFTCDGADVSPPLAWTEGPPGTKSYAVVFRDESITLTHAAIYDIPAGTKALPKDVEKAYEPANVAGAKQTQGFRLTGFGWAGPCPPSKHTYAFTLYALDVETLPGTSEDTTRADLEELVEGASLASAKLTVTYER